MKRLRSCTCLLLAAAAMSSCRGGEPERPSATTLRLDRSPSGDVALFLDHAPENVRALQVELSISGSSAFEMSRAAPPAGLPLDTVRLAMRGTNRAILFAGDKRGARLPVAGTVAVFSVRPTTKGGAGDARLSIDHAQLVDSEGAPVEVVLGPAIAVR